MSQPKVVRSLLLLLFLGVVTGGIFFLLSLQLMPLFHEISYTISTTNSVMAEAAQQSAPTPTMSALTLDMVATVPATPTAPVPTAVTPALLPTALPSQMGTVNSDVVNLRSYPSLAGEIVGQAKAGEQFQITAISKDGLWVQICCPLGSSEATLQSWVAIEFMVLGPALASAQVALSPIPVVTQPSPAAHLPISGGATVSGTVNSVLVNLRSGPDTTYPTVGQVSEQTKVTITGRNAAGTWWQICCTPGSSQASWIRAEFIDLAVAKETAMAQLAIVP